MKIAKITATPVHLPLSIALVGAARPASLGGCLVEIETDGGLTDSRRSPRRR
jgi:L-rhamnonate dehydratase